MNKLSLVIPTYNEKDNIQKLVKEVFSIFSRKSINGEIIIVDDNSPDGTGKIADEMHKKNKNVISLHRTGKLGLSSAVLYGFSKASGNVLGVMDADLSHPPEKIADMMDKINSGADFVIGSRYIKGGKIEGWNSYRKIVSRGGTLLAKLFTKAKDPMSGFLMIKKECIDGVKLNPKGFKICLELLVKAEYKKLEEVPITFVNRAAGKSKLNTSEYFSLLENLAGYLFYTDTAKQALKFGLVGASGILVNLAVMYAMTDIISMYYMISAVIAFAVANTSNFILNKIWTFKETVKEKFGEKFIKFFAVGIVGLIVNLAFLYIFVEYFEIWYMYAQILAIIIAFAVNFVGNKIWTFR